MPDWLQALDEVEAEATASEVAGADTASPAAPAGMAWVDGSTAPASVEDVAFGEAASAAAAGPEARAAEERSGTELVTAPAAATPVDAAAHPSWDGAALRTVAEHLERLAARARRLAETPALAAVDSDPLDLFLLGYVLGWRRGQQARGAESV
jgi:hypothetical protein